MILILLIVTVGILSIQFILFQVNFYYGAPAPYAESIAPSHHSTYAHYYDDEEDGWEMPNFYNET